MSTTTSGLAAGAASFVVAAVLLMVNGVAHARCLGDGLASALL